jgi:hypothetical protein
MGFHLPERGVVSMPAVMARIRITIDTEEAHKRAFMARASIEGLSPQEMFQKLVEQYCPEDYDRAMKHIGEGAEEEPEGGSRKSGKRRSS